MVEHMLQRVSSSDLQPSKVPDPSPKATNPGDLQPSHVGRIFHCCEECEKRGPGELCAKRVGVDIITLHNVGELHAAVWFISGNRGSAKALSTRLHAHISHTHAPAGLQRHMHNRWHSAVPGSMENADLAGSTRMELTCRCIGLATAQKLDR